MGIGKKIKKIIDQKGTNINQVAVGAGIPPMTLYSIIKRDNSKIDIDILLKICDYLNVNVEEIYYGNSKSPITDFELELVQAYRVQPINIQKAICIMLNIEPQKIEQNAPYGMARIAAHGLGTYEIPATAPLSEEETEKFFPSDKEVK